MERPNATPTAPNCLSSELAEFICSGISITASSRDGRFIPSISRVLACSINSQRTQLRIFLVKSQALQLLRDITSSGEIAVVFSQPSSHRTLQIKSTNAHPCSLEQRDIALIEASLRNFAEDLSLIDYPREFAHAFHHFTPDDLLVISFSPSALFEQSPGPDAGKAMEFA